MYFRYALCAPLSLAFNLLVIMTSPLWAGIAAAFRLETLPGPLSWVHTHDNNIYGGAVPASFAGRFKVAIWWLVRNPGYGFDAYVLGFAGSAVVSQATHPNVVEWGQGGAKRTDTMTLADGSARFSYRRDIALWGDRYAKVWLGWHYHDQAGRRMLKFDINPFKRAA